MKRTILCLVATAFFALGVGSAFAEDQDLKTDKAIEKFWQQRAVENSGGQ